MTSERAKPQIVPAGKKQLLFVTDAEDRSVGVDTEDIRYIKLAEEPLARSAGLTCIRCEWGTHMVRDTPEDIRGALKGEPTAEPVTSGD